MARYVALVRGVNVGGRGKLPMARLRELAAGVGGDVATYLQSGNVVLSSAAPAAAVRGALEKGVSAELGNAATVVVLTAAQLRQVAERNPFGAEGAPEGELHAVFLAERPSAASLRGLDPTFGEPDAFCVDGAVVYLRLRSGMGRTKLVASWFERRLGVAGTARNWRTVSALLDLAASAA